jgi:hypothetical protein
MPVRTRAQRRAEAGRNGDREPRQADAEIGTPATPESSESCTEHAESSVASNLTPRSFRGTESASTLSTEGSRVSSPSVSVTLGTETRSLDSDSTSLSGFIVRDDDPALENEATSSRRLLGEDEDDDSSDRSIEEEMASVLAMLRNGSHRKRR